MVTNSDPLQGHDIDLPEGASFVPKTPSEEALREAKYEQMESDLRPIENIEDENKTEENDE